LGNGGGSGGRVNQMIKRGGVSRGRLAVCNTVLVLSSDQVLVSGGGKGGVVSESWC